MTDIDNDTAILVGLGLVTAGAIGYIAYDTASESTEYENSTILGPAGTSSASETPGGTLGPADVYTGTYAEGEAPSTTGNSEIQQIENTVAWVSIAAIAIGATFMMTPIIVEFMLTREAVREGARAARG